MRPQGSNNEGKPTTRDGSPVSWRTEFVDATIKVPSHACPLIRQAKPVIFLDGSAASLGLATAIFRVLAVRFRFGGIGHDCTPSRHHRYCNGFCGSLFPVKIRLQPYTHIYTCEQLVMPDRRLLKARGADWSLG